MKEGTSHQSRVTTPKQEGHSLESPPERRQNLASDKSECTAKLIGWVLQGGVILSASIILIGLLMLPLRPGGLSVNRLLSFPHTLGQVWAGLLVLRPQAIIALGLLLLIATPILRVAVSIVAFAFERDLRFVVITSLVLAILLLSNVLLGSMVGSTSHTTVPHLNFSLVVVLLIFGGSIVAGVLGSLIGLGGGVLIVPLLSLVFGLPIYVAIGASIVSVIATSSGAAAAYVRDHLTNLRVGMFLELGTTTGAITGAFLAVLLAPNLLFVLFRGRLADFLSPAGVQDRRGIAAGSKERSSGTLAGTLWHVSGSTFGATDSLPGDPYTAWSGDDVCGRNHLRTTRYRQWHL